MARADRAPAPRLKLRDLLARWGEARPLPGLAASAARPIRGWLLLSLITVYALTGLFGHGPWRGDDILGVALSRSVLDGLTGAGELSLLPDLAGDIHLRHGPLAAWLAALLMFPFESLHMALFGQGLSPTVLDDLVRLVQAGWLVLGLYALWRGTMRLALRREARPIDPLGIGPDASAYGRTLGDCAVLLALACLGTATRWHEAGPASLSFFLQASLIWAIAVAPERPAHAGRWIGLLLAALLLTDGLETALAHGLAVLALAWLVHPVRLVQRELLLAGSLVLLALLLAWTLAALAVDGAERTGLWWDAQLWSNTQSLWRAMNTWAWTWWPLWPIVLVLIAQAKRHGLLALAHIQILLALLSAQVLVGVTGLGLSEPGRLLPVASLAALAAFGLLSIPRSLTSLLDWFAVVVFSALGILIWLYWSAMVFQFPENLASRLDYFAPGLTRPEPSTTEVLFGTAVSGLWVSLVIWRIRRTGQQLWRPVALTSGGLGLAWILMMTLWMPALEINRGHRPVSDELNAAVSAAWVQLGYQASDARACISVPEGDTSARLLVLATVSSRIGTPSAACPLTVRTTPAAPDDTLLWSGSRATDRDSRERYVLLLTDKPKKLLR